MFTLHRDPCARLAGTLTRSDVPLLRRALDDLLASRHPVLIDVSRLAVPYPPAVGVLSSALLDAGGWPAARLVVVGADARFRAALRSTGTARDVVVADDVHDAASRVHHRPERVRRRLALRPGAQPRAFVDRLGVDWDLGDLVDEAREVVDELADGGGVLTATLGPEGLRVALRDFHARPRLAVPAAVRRRAASCGVTPRSDGNVVWAVLGVRRRPAGTSSP